MVKRLRLLLFAIIVFGCVNAHAGSVSLFQIGEEDCSIGTGTYTTGKGRSRTKLNTSTWPYEATGYTALSPDDIVDGGYDVTIKPGQIISGGPEISIQRYTDFATAISTIGSTETTLVIDEDTAVNATVAIPTTLSIRMVRPGKFSIATGVTLTVNGQFESPLYQCISYAGTGTLAFGNTGRVKESHPHWWGANGGSTDDSTALQNAIDAVDGAGIPVKVFRGLALKNGVTVSSGIIIRGESQENTIIYLYDGVGWAAGEAAFSGTTLTGNVFSDFQINGSNLTPTTYTNLKGINLINAGSQTIRNLKITGTTGHSLETREMVASSCQENKLINLDLGNIQDNGTTQDAKALHVYSIFNVASGTPPNRKTLIKNVKLRESRAAELAQLFLYESKIIDCDFEAPTDRDTAICLTLVYGQNLISGTRFVNTRRTCLEILHDLDGLVIENCHIETGEDDPATHRGIVDNSGSGFPQGVVKILNNNFYVSRNALYLNGQPAHQYIVKGNSFVAKSDFAAGVLVQNGLTYPSEMIFTNNVLDGSAALQSLSYLVDMFSVRAIVKNNFFTGGTGDGDMRAYRNNGGNNCIFEGNLIKNIVNGYFLALSSTTDNIIQGNQFYNVTNPIMGNATAIASRTNIIRDNWGYVTENSGTATIANGDTSVVVAHGLDRLPAAGDILLTPAETWSSATELWTGSYSVTSFTITVDQDPTADFDVNWKAEIF